MTTKLGILARRLNSGVPSTEEPENATSQMMISYKGDVDRKAKETVRVVEDKLAAAQAEIESLKAQLVDAGKDTTRGIKEYGFKLDAVKDTHRQELETLANKNRDLVGTVYADLESAKLALSIECQARVKAETERDGAQKMCALLEQTVAKLQADIKAKPVTIAAAAARKPLKIRVTQRDENGRIIELSEV